MRNFRRTLALLAVLCGAASSAHSDVGGSWTGPLQPLAVARQEVGAARSGNFVYVIGGLLAGPGFGATATVERYSIANGTWSSVTPLPAARDHLGVCATGGLVYAIGGFAGDFAAKSEVWAYDASHLSWTARAPLPLPRGGLWAVAHNTRVYAFGGVDASGAAQRSTYVYAPTTNNWSPGADMPTAREHLMAVTLGTYIYVIGGRTSVALDVNERYDPLLDSWTTLAPMPTARAASGIAAIDGRIYVLGGETPMLHAVCEVYDPATNMWSTQDPMPVPRHGLSAVTVDDHIFMAGGAVVQGLQATTYVDAFRPLAVQATHVCDCASSGPCANSASEAGCRNSTGAGGELTATGSARVSGDTLVLRVSALPPTTSVLFFQGTTLVQGGAGSPFGDGLRCAGGSVVRLATRATSGGAIEYPGAGDATVSVRGLVASPALRHYQVWYRNPAGPCGTGSNLTNAVSVNWEF